MELLLAIFIGALTAGGVYLCLRARSFDLVFGLSLLSYAVNLMLFASGRVRVNADPVIRDGVPATLAHYTDPLPQALVLTAIVIALAMTALLVVLAIRNHREQGSDHVDGEERP
jgi:multicomponent K+:H+ antiporter subunit C